MDSRRILITGLSKYWGLRLAQALEKWPSVEAIVGVDTDDPTGELERTEFVRVGTQHALLRRIVEAAEIDTVVDTRLVVDSITTSAKNAHENNVIGTMNILAACGGHGSTVKKFVFKSSAHYYGAEQDDPAFFTESMGRPHPPRTPVERDILEAEAAVRDFGDKAPDVDVSILRFANVLGPDVSTSHTKLFSLPVVPTIFGFDPRYQFVHEDDVVHALEHMVKFHRPGVYNVAGDGVLALTEVIDLLGKQWAPLLPPWGTALAAAPLRRLGLRVPPEMLSQMRFGRGLDNRKLKAAGFEYRYTSRETVMKLAEHMRLHPIMRDVREPYRYEHDVEDFLRWSPNVKNATGKRGSLLSREQLVELRKLLDAYGETAGLFEGEAPKEKPKAARRRPEAAKPAPPPAPEPAPDPLPEYAELEAEEIIAMLGSLERPELEALRELERSSRGRDSVLTAVDGLLARQAAAQ
jgi:UDP-glucose 4-epimerase